MILLFGAISLGASVRYPLGFGSGFFSPEDYAVTSLRNLLLNVSLVDSSLYGY